MYEMSVEGWKYLIGVYIFNASSIKCLFFI